VIDDGSMGEKELVEHFKNLWQAHWEFFATSNNLTAPEFDGDFKGLALPEAVLEKIFRSNAKKAYRF